MKTLTLTLCDRTAPPPNTTNPARSHPYHYAHATPSSLPPRFHIERHPIQGYRAYFTPLIPTPLTPDATNTPGPIPSVPSVHYSPYHPTADLALADHLPNYIEDLIAYEAFQTLLALSQRFDGRAVINAFELLKEINPDDDYYLDAAAGRVEPISAPDDLYA